MEQFGFVRFADTSMKEKFFRKTTSALSANIRLPTLKKYNGNKKEA